MNLIIQFIAHNVTFNLQWYELHDPAPHSVSRLCAQLVNHLCSVIVQSPLFKVANYSSYVPDVQDWCRIRWKRLATMG